MIMITIMIWMMMLTCDRSPCIPQKELNDHHDADDYMIVITIAMLMMMLTCDRSPCIPQKEC